MPHRVNPAKAENASRVVVSATVASVVDAIATVVAVASATAAPGSTVSPVRQ